MLTPSSEAHGGGLLAVDADDLVIGATRSARAALGIAVDRMMEPTPTGDLLGDATRDKFGDVQRGVLQRALVRSHGNVSAAAKTLGVESRHPSSQAEAVRNDATGLIATTDDCRRFATDRCGELKPPT